MSLHFSLDIKASAAFENTQKSKVLFCNKCTLIDDGFEVKKAPNSTKDHKVDGCDSHAHLPKILIICKDHYGSKTHKSLNYQCSFTLSHLPVFFSALI